MENSIDLSGLKGLHLPLEPDFFPLAIGWWVALLLLLIILIGAISIGFYFWFDPMRQAFRELKLIYQAHPDHNIAFAKEVSKLLKRVAILKFGRETVAQLSGPQWATFLKEHGGQSLSFNQANLIAYSTYLPPSAAEPIPVTELNAAAQKWIQYVFKGK